MKTLLTLLTVLTLSTPDSLFNLLTSYHPGDTIRIETSGIAPTSVRGLKLDTAVTNPASLDWMQFKCATSVTHFWGKGTVQASAFSQMTRRPGRASLAMCKPEFDWRMVAGINSVRSDTAGLPVHDVPALLSYISRVEEFMSVGQASPELLVYMPRLDRRIVRAIYEAGYDMDFASALMIDSIRSLDDDGFLVAPSGIRYRALVVPNLKNTTPELRKRITWFEERGATVIYAPDGDYAAALDHNRYLRPETLRSAQGLYVTRRFESQGTYRYFVVNTQGKTITDWVHLAIPYRAAEFIDPMTGRSSLGELRHDSLFLSIRSGESVLIRTTMTRGDIPITPVFHGSSTVDLSEEKWILYPSENVRSRNESIWETKLEKLCYWSRLWNDAVGTMRYSCTFRFTDMPKKGVPYRILLSLPDMHESAQIFVNGNEVGTIFALPYQLDITDYIVSGKNMLDIDVTSLDANYLGTAGKSKTAGLSKVQLIIQH